MSTVLKEQISNPRLNTTGMINTDGKWDGKTRVSPKPHKTPMNKDKWDFTFHSNERDHEGHKVSEVIGAHRPSFTDRMRAKQENYKEIRTSENFGKDHMPAVLELEEVQETKRMRLFNSMKSLATQAGSSISFAIREAPGIMQAPFNSVSRGLFCCVTVNTSYEN